jgi:hypothetical protein
VETRIGSLRLHRWVKPDDDRAFHDHPWWFLTIVLRGGYTDRGPQGDDRLRVGSVRFRAALHRHTVIPGPHGAWTLLVTGPIARPWGFWLGGKFRKANKWFARYGHHPCALGSFHVAQACLMDGRQGDAGRQRTRWGWCRVGEGTPLTRHPSITRRSGRIHPSGRRR